MSELLMLYNCSMTIFMCMAGLYFIVAVWVCVFDWAFKTEYHKSIWFFGDWYGTKNNDS